mgnify:CR=1 FL=1
MARRKTIGIVLGALVVLAVAVAAAVYLAARHFVDQEQQVRTVWQVDVGELLGRDEELDLEICQVALEADLTVIQLVPFEVDQEGFTYYDVSVQDRLAQALEQGSSSFSIPFDRQQLADYLGVDRSALSKELGRMRNEGILTFRKNHFQLHRTVER